MNRVMCGSQEPFRNAQSPPKGSMESSFLFIAGGARPGMSLMFLLCGLTICKRVRLVIDCMGKHYIYDEVNRQWPKWLREKR